MTFQVLISTMHEIDLSLLEKMNVSSDAVIINQTDCDSIRKIHYKNHLIIWVNSKERGSSKSRNLGLKFCNADVILLADNDEILVDNYETLILNEFDKNNADLMTFNIYSIGNKRNRYFNKKIKKLNFFNIFRYGSARIAFKSKFILENNINFNESYGPGTKRLNGEDSLFLNDVLKSSGICKTSPLKIADINDENSSWFVGYNVEYFYNKGYFLHELCGKKGKLAILYYFFRHKDQTRDIGGLIALKSMFKGYSDFNNS